MEYKANRREIILKNMQASEEKGLHCHGCSGKCCTFVANSMQVTPLEAWEIFQYLKDNGLWEQEEAGILNCIEEYRLDYHLDTGSGHGFRRTYTCPFFTPGPRGCRLPREIKPYGCLAFNPKSAGITEGQDCASDTAILEQREASFQQFEKGENDRLKEIFGFSWQKAAIPVALRDLFRAL